MEDLEMLEPWLVLQKIPGLGLTRIHQLLEHFLHPQLILQSGPELGGYLSSEQMQFLSQLQKNNGRHPANQQVKKEIDYLQANDIQAVTIDSELYPKILREIYNPPLVLYVKGDPYLLAEPQLAIVGARKASKSALDIAYKWSSQLTDYGLTITSGLALGIDGAAHAGALSGSGHTVAVLAHGLDQVYPRQHQKLSEQIIESGALVTEFPIGMLPKKDHFPRRNRIVSGLSLGVLVVEAALKSGSLISARYALEQNREVFAVPGSINNVMVGGCHYLIKEGAFLVESVGEIIDALSWETSLLNAGGMDQHVLANSSPPGSQALSASAQRVLDVVPFDLVHIDDLLVESGINIADLNRELLLLEINGLVEAVAGNYRRI